MVATKEHTGSLIVAAYHKSDLLNFPSLEIQVEELIDLIKYRISQKDIKVVSSELRTKTYEVRRVIIDWFVKEGRTVEEFLSEIDSKFMMPTESALFNTFKNEITNALGAYKTIYGGVADKTGLSDCSTFREQAIPPYSAFELIGKYPSPYFQYFKKWIDESLNLDIVFALSYLILKREINIENPRIEKEIIPFLKKTITRFGAYSIFLGIWKPGENNSSQLFQNIQILASTLFMENGQYTQLKQSDFHHFLHN